MKRPGFHAAVSLLILACGVAAASFGPIVAFADQWPLYEALRTTAAIIFAVVGAWIAIAFPDRVRLLANPHQDSAAGAHGARFLDLFAPVVNSTFILCAVLLIGIAAPIVKGVVAASPGVVEWLRRGSFGLLVVLTLWQVWTVVLTLLPADILKSAMQRDIVANRHITALRGLGSEQRPDDHSGA